jgi:hypothetical protein
MDEVSDVWKPGSDTASLGSLSDGQIKGISPNGTIDNTSEGYEFEINYQPTANWNIQINGSKTDAYRENLGAPMLAFIEKQWEKWQGPAGDIRLWWGGDNEIRQYYSDNIIAAVDFQKESIGQQAPELRPWSFALVTNYKFTDGRFNGMNVGGSYRWQDEQILGYGLKSDNSGLDVHRSLHGGSEGHLDFWVGYNTKLTDTVNWRIQLNVRNAFESDGLIAISANPDGQVATYRIQQGMSWFITNTFEF